MLQHICNCIAGPAHNVLQSTGRHIYAVKTWSEPRDTGARRKGERPIENANDVCDRNLGRIAQQAMSAPRAASALDEAVVSQLDQDRLEELTGDGFTLRNTRGMYPQLAFCPLSKHCHGADRVLSLAGKHLVALSAKQRILSQYGREQATSWASPSGSHHSTVAACAWGLPLGSVKADVPRRWRLIVSLCLGKESMTKLVRLGNRELKQHPSQTGVAND